MKNSKIKNLNSLELFKFFEINSDSLKNIDGGSELSEWFVGKFGEARGLCYYYGKRAIDLCRTETFM